MKAIIAASGVSHLFVNACRFVKRSDEYATPSLGEPVIGGVYYSPFYCVT
jgi:hypothetical protein